jgi:AhpD family alkylhydroperoxidase
MTDTTDTPVAPHVVPQTRFGDVDGLDKAYGAMAHFDHAIDLDPVLRELVKLRASVLNGCAFCVDMHTTDARAAGETDRRLASVMAWPHAPFFTARERAALRLTDAMTLLDGHGEGVSDEVWDEAKAHFDPTELGQLVMAITAINSWNRIAVTLLSTPPLD